MAEIGASFIFTKGAGLVTIPLYDASLKFFGMNLLVCGSRQVDCLSGLVDFLGEDLV